MSRVVSLIRSPALSDVADYAYASTVEPGVRWVFPAGACPLDKDGAIVAPGDYIAQAKACVENLRVALADAGATLEDVAMTRVLVASTRQSDLSATYDAVREVFGDHDVPSTLIGVTVLGYTGQLVEVEAVAAVPA